MRKIKSTASGSIALRKGATIMVTYPHSPFETGDDVDDFEGWLIGSGAGPSDTEVFNFAGPIGDVLEDRKFKYVAANEISETRLVALKARADELNVVIDVREL